MITMILAIVITLLIGVLVDLFVDVSIAEPGSCAAARGLDL
jgi:hypothetical protein